MANWNQMAVFLQRLWGPLMQVETYTLYSNQVLQWMRESYSPGKSPMNFSIIALKLSSLCTYQSHGWLSPVGAVSQKSSLRPNGGDAQSSSTGDKHAGEMSVDTSAHGISVMWFNLVKMEWNLGCGCLFGGTERMFYEYLSSCRW